MKKKISSLCKTSYQALLNILNLIITLNTVFQPNFHFFFLEFEAPFYYDRIISIILIFLELFKMLLWCYILPYVIVVAHFSQFLSQCCPTLEVVSVLTVDWVFKLRIYSYYGRLNNDLPNIFISLSLELWNTFP